MPWAQLDPLSEPMRDFTLGRGISRSTVRSLQLLEALLRVRRCGRFFFFRVGQTELFHFVSQRIPADVEQLCCLNLIAMRLLERQLHQRVLYVF